LPLLEEPTFARSIEPRALLPELPLPAQGGRSLRVMLVPRAAPPTLPLLGGRLLLLLPKPDGARPRSVVLPCASQVRLPERLFVALFWGRWELLLMAPRAALPSALVRMLEFGLSSESSRCREDIAPPFIGELLERPEFMGVFVCGRLPELPEFSKPRPLFVGRPLPPRTDELSAARNVPELKERVGICEAPDAGVLRATTERF
jgi:hypothetical protein